MKLFLAAPCSGLPSRPVALPSQASRLHLLTKLVLAAPWSAFPSRPTARLSHDCASAVLTANVAINAATIMRFIASYLFFALVVQSGWSHLVLDEPDDCGNDRARHAPACSLTNERTEVNRVRGLRQQRNEGGEKLSADTAADCARNCIAERAQADILGCRPGHITSDRARDDLDDEIDEKFRHISLHGLSLVSTSGLDIGRQLAAIGGEFRHDLLVQPHVHGGGIIGVAGVFQLGSKLLPRRDAAVEIESFHQVDNGRSPGKFLAFGCGCLIDDFCNIDCLSRSTWRCRG